MKHLDKYRNQAIRILIFGAKHNRELFAGYNRNEFYIYNELGGLKNCENNEFVNVAIVSYVNDIKDREIVGIIDRLPKFQEISIHSV